MNPLPGEKTVNITGAIPLFGGWPKMTDPGNLTVRDDTGDFQKREQDEKMEGLDLYFYDRLWNIPT